MNRPIEFRLWAKDVNGISKMMFPGDKHLLHIYFDEIPWDEKTSGILMQFTGLLDKNGKKIFEGDIVKSNNQGTLFEVFGINLPDYTKGVVKFISCGFSVCQTNIGATSIDEFSNCACCPSSLEVIGNIFENRD